MTERDGFDRDPTGKVPEGWLSGVTGLDDPALWTATRYCPPIELRKELLGVSDDVAAEQLASCQRRVAEANDANHPQPARP